MSSSLSSRPEDVHEDRQHQAGRSRGSGFPAGECAWRSIQQDWIRRLEKPEAAEDKWLGGLYIANANVVGLTCLESGQRSFYENDDFEPFAQKLEPFIEYGAQFLTSSQLTDNKTLMR